MDESDKMNLAASDLIEAAKEFTEQLRARKAESLNIIGTHPEQTYNDIVDVTALACSFKSAVLTIIGGDTAFIKANATGNVGFEKRDDAFCNIAIQQPDDVLIVPDATKDERFRDHWKVKHKIVHAYAGVPIVTDDGYAIGALCIIDDHPRTISDHELTLLKKMARIVTKLLAAGVKR